jgi:DNA excision repair protein ERCC-4
MPPRKHPPPPPTFPTVIVIDTREQSPYTFASIRSDARDGGKLLAITTRRGTLRSGDYSLLGYERRIAVERKSLADLYGTLGRGRARFERELARLAAMQFAAVVVEAEWSEVLGSPPPRSRLNPKTIYRSVLAWQQRYPSVHWWFLPGRAYGEVTTFRILDRFLRESQPLKETNPCNETYSVKRPAASPAPCVGRLRSAGLTAATSTSVAANRRRRVGPKPAVRSTTGS